MNSKKIIRKLEKDNEFVKGVNDIIKNIGLFSEKAIYLIDIPYCDIKDSEECSFIINEDIYNYVLGLNKSCVLLGKRFNYYGQEFIYINDIMQDYGYFIENNKDYDTCILYQPKEKILNKTLEQDKVVDYCNNNRAKYNLRKQGMNLSFKDIKDLIDFNEYFFDKDIKAFKLIKNDNELNIIYNDNDVIKAVIHIYVANSQFENFTPVSTYFQHEYIQNKKRKV